MRSSPRSVVFIALSLRVLHERAVGRIEPLVAMSGHMPTDASLTNSSDSLDYSVGTRQK
jgi:hypothetical protein